MSKKDEALKLAEDALKRVRTQDMELVQMSMIALAAIREALAEQQKLVVTNKVYVTREQLAELYPPAQRTWVGLTDDEILYCVELENPKAIVEEVEAKLKEKNA